MNPFIKLGLSPEVVDVLDQLGFKVPTPIQEQSIPLLLEEPPRDFIGLAQTGTGKTAAFGLPLVQLVDRKNTNTQVLIMAPTRELGQQTAKQLVEFASHDTHLNVECVYGGANISTQIKALKRPVQILVATPGRLLDLINRRAVSLHDVHYVILDEADEMLNMGFKEDIDLILEKTPEKRVTWLFSATMPAEIRRIVKKYMENPVEVSVMTEQKTNVNITHQYVVTKTGNKIAAVRRFLDVQPDMRGIMFCRTRLETQRIADDLGELGYGVEALHGELSQAQRDAVMKRFKSRSMQLLVATDVAARGIDVNDLTHVLHHSLPDQLESYTHRSGRTGRAGKTGISIAFINSREGQKVKELERINKLTFEKIDVPNRDQIESIRIRSWAHKLHETKWDKRAEEVLKGLEDEFIDLTKEEILLKLVSVQLEQLKKGDGIEGDLNESHSGSDRKESNSTTNRYFINVGSMDGLDANDVLHFLADISAVAPSAFGDMSLQKNCTFFDLDKKVDNGFAKLFDGIEVDGRAIRVNRDEERPARRSDGGGRGFKERGKGGSGRRTGGWEPPKGKSGSKPYEKSGSKPYEKSASKPYDKAKGGRKVKPKKNKY
ncbi:MAG: DEAD/DEAH box helicase [Bacteroidetes bacterium]|nr:DEAD/DEAH box helicase [Bacteroidota bacterium]